MLLDTVIIVCNYLKKKKKSLLFVCVPDFKVLKEEGPPHMKSFVVRVTVGEFTGEGEGKSKKIAKKLAAAAVLGELKKLPHIPSVEKLLPRIKKKNKSIIKVTAGLRSLRTTLRFLY